MSDLPRQKSNFPQNKEVQFSIHFCSTLCIKYFLICKMKRYVIIFLYIKIDFWHDRSGRSWLSYPITFLCMSTYWKIMARQKNKDGCCQLGFSVSLIFHKTNKSVSAKILLVYLCRFCRQRKVKTFSSCGAHFRSGDNIFSVQIATTTVCITRKMHLYKHLSRFLGRSHDFSSV